MKYLEILKKKWKMFFCWGLFCMSLLFSLLVFIIKPTVPQTYYPYSYSKRNFESIKFPIFQHFNIQNNKLKQIHLVLSDENIVKDNHSINQHDYDIKVYDEEKNLYYSNHFHNYALDSVDIELNDVNSNNIILEIDCEECNDVKMSLKKSINKSNNYIELNEEDKVLEFHNIYLIHNNSYYWYTLVGITIFFILYPLAKEDIKYEK